MGSARTTSLRMSCSKKLKLSSTCCRRWKSWARNVSACPQIHIAGEAALTVARRLRSHLLRNPTAAVYLPYPMSTSEKPPCQTRSTGCVWRKHRIVRGRVRGTLSRHLSLHCYIYPAFNQPPIIDHLLSDQFAFRPTGSTTAVIVSIIHQVIDLLKTNK